jgi:hypothetical protein
MRFKWMLCAALGASSILAYAGEPKAYQTGELLEMNSVQCGAAEKGIDNSTGQVRDTDVRSKEAQLGVCQEYVLTTERVVYRIHSVDEKNSLLLPVGDRVQFRIQKNKLLVRVVNLSNKELEYEVVSITPRTENSNADAIPLRLNHLQ